MSPHPSDLALDRLLTGEAVAPDVRTHLDGCDACAARLAELTRAAHEFVATAPIARLTAATEQRLATERWRRRRRELVYGASAVLAAAAVLLLMLRPPPPIYRTKGGGLVLDVFRKRASGVVEMLLPSGQASPGEALRFRVGTPEPGFAAILSIDGAGTVTSYFPTTAELAPIERGRNQLLDATIELDRTLGRERLIALVCPRRLPLSKVREAVAAELARVHGDAAAVEPARAAPECATTSFWFAKVPSR
jgi:hypothetical protein